MGSATRYAWFTDEWYRVTKPDCAKAGCELCRPAKKRGRAFCYRRKRKVAESQPWSVAEWAVALRFDHSRATVLVPLLGDTP